MRDSLMAHQKVLPSFNKTALPAQMDLCLDEVKRDKYEKPEASSCFETFFLDVQF
jgi:hypothetical protein